ncbi:MAG: cysteine--tRNA ligase [Candidatus Uhrbacteria bacterium]|nr:cysteine--tRNA ligase [Candidatus Uhrbacteria bacterium]
MIKLYNTLSRKKEVFKPLKGNTVRMYACGPTVYNYPHIGNLRAYIFDDTLRRVLLLNNYRVKLVINVTDVGHLTSDADIGEDKMLLGAQREGKTVWELAKFYTEAFLENIADLNILPPTVLCKATDHIWLQIELIQKLEKKGYTYVAGGNVYFDTSKVQDYGKLAGFKKQQAPSVARVEKDANKKNQNDFVLWFTKSKFDSQDMKWDSPWGVGYPGWHIECSAMSTYYLGQPLDIHTGGIDHIPVHHTNEIAQSEATTGKPLAKFWIHNEFLLTGSEKMAKSSGKFLTLASAFKEKGYNPIVYRFFCLQAHYRQQLNFSYEAIDAAVSGYESLCSAVTLCKSRAKARMKMSQATSILLDKTHAKFLSALNDDLGTPAALASLFELIRTVNKKEKTLTGGDYAALHSFFLYADCALGLGLEKAGKNDIPAHIIELSNKRELARKEKRWPDADVIRAEIEQYGYSVMDTKDGITISRNLRSSSVSVIPDSDPGSR